MMERRIGLRGIGLATGLLLAGCGGGSGGDAPEDNTVGDVAEESTVGDVTGGDNAGDDLAGDTGTVVVPVSCNVDPLAEDCQITEDPPAPEESAPEFIAAGSTLTGTIGSGESQLFRVPSGAEISLISSGGDADLFLFDNGEVRTNDTVLCVSGWPVAEDNCTATVNGGEVYAEVVGFTAAEFSLSASTDCSVPAVNEWVYRNMQDYYLYADTVPDVNPADYATSVELLRDLRFEELDPFSGISNAVARQDFFLTGGSFGFGNGFAFDDDGNLRITFVFNDSPFGRANVQRGDIVVSINNEPISDILNSGRFVEVIGDRDNPITNVWTFTDGETGSLKEASIAQGEFTVNSVLHDFIYEHPSFAGSIGYIVFSDFINTSAAELDAVLANFASEGVSELILDLRYNGGGLISVANKLSSQIGGPDLAGLIMTITEWNSTYSALNTQDLFELATPSLDLDRLVVIGGPATASASELVKNSLEPYMDVVLIGERTAGKPFISRSKVYCGQALNAMDSQSVNANSVSVAGGIEADCYAADDVTRRFGGIGDNIEGMVLKALDYVVFGTCEAEPALAKQNTGKSKTLSLLNRERPDTGFQMDSFKDKRYLLKN